MSIFLTSYFIFTLLLSFFNVYLICRIESIEILSDAGILHSSPVDELTKEDNLIISFLIIDFLYLLVSTVISLAYFSPFTSTIWIIILIAINFFGGNFAMKKLSKMKSVQLYFADKKSKIPLAIVDLKLDMHEVEELNSENLKLSQYIYPKLNSEFVQKLREIRSYSLDKYPETNYSEGYFFPLYIELKSFKSLLNDKELPIDSTQISAYLLDNISFLTTVMTILKDEKLIEALYSLEGLKELTELTTEFNELNNGLKKVVYTIKNTKQTLIKAEKSSDVFEGLNTIHSMREFSKSLK